MNIEAVLLSLDIMWKGMFGIFTVIILITLLVIIMQKIDVAIEAKHNK